MNRKQKHYYVYERKKARILSATIHCLVLLLAIFGLPDFLIPQPPVEPAAISVEILPITGITNIKPSEPAETKESKQEEKPPEKTAAPAPIKNAEAEPPPEPAPVVKAKEKPKPEIKKPEPKKELPKEVPKKPADQDFQKLLNDLKKQPEKRKVEQGKNNTPSPDAKSNQYNPSLPMSMTETDAIKTWFAKCWTVPIGAKDVKNLVPVLLIQLNHDGSLISVEMTSATKSRASTDSFFRAATESAIRAVKMCTPITILPPEKYETWRVTELSFTPEN